VPLQTTIPLDEVLHIARQIAEALEYAHERRMIHRELKPANVKARPDGTVKILDFGLAKALEDSPASGDINTSPTLTVAATREGVILGTAAYMSPEQAKGKVVDRRADIWAFGCVLYEMLTGTQAFQGETVSDVLAAVIMKEPDWSTVPRSTPAAIRKLLRRCLEKDPRRRLQAIGEARLVIESPEEGTAPEDSQASRRHGFEWGIAGVLLGGLISGAILRIITPQAPLRQVRHLEIMLLPALSISTPNPTELALSPDGTNLVFSAQQGDKTQLYQRRLEETEAKPIAGTEGGVAPFFSPDGASVAFLKETAAGLALEKTSLTGGPVQSLCTNHSSFPGSWSSDGTIFFANTHLDGLARVPGTGGTCQDLTTPDKGQGEVSHRGPQVLPGGQALLFNVFRGFSAAHGSIAVLSLRTGKWQTLIQGEPILVTSRKVSWFMGGAAL